MAQRGIKITEELKQALVLELDKCLGRVVEYPRDCETLSLFILETHGELISTTTLKRLYGFAKSTNSYSQKVLDSVAKVCGYQNWADFTEINKSKGEKDYASKIKLRELSLGFALQAVSPHWQTPKDLDGFLGSDATFYLLSGVIQSGKTTALLKLVKDKKAKYFNCKSDTVSIDEDSEPIILLDDADFLFKDSESLFTTFANCLLLNKKCVLAISSKNWVSFKTLFASHFNFRSKFYPLPWEDNTYNNVALLNSADIKHTLDQLNISSSFDRTTTHLEKLLAHPNLLLEYAAVCKERKLNENLHPAVHNILLTASVINRLLNSELANINTKQLIERLSRSTFTSDSTEEILSYKLSKPTPTISFSALAYIMVKEGISVKPYNNLKLKDLYYSFYLQKHPKQLSKIDSEISTEDDFLQYSSLANWLIYTYPETYDEVLAKHPKLAYIVYVNCIDYATLASKGEERYSNFLKQNLKPDEVGFCYGLLLHVAVYNKDVNLAKRYLPLAKKLLASTERMHILPLSRLYSGIYMVNYMLGIDNNTYADTPIKETYTHGQYILPFWQLFAQIALVYTSEYKQALGIEKQVDYTGLVSESKEGILKSLFILRPLILKLNNTDYLATLGDIDRHCIECYHMRAFNQVLLNVLMDKKDVRSFGIRILYQKKAQELKHATAS